MGQNRPDRYVGVDLNRVRKRPTSTNVEVAIFDEFDFVNNHKTILKRYPDRFTHATCLEVIEHMPVVAGARLLENLADILAPGGVLLLSTPVYDGVHHAKNHVHEYTVEELQGAIEAAGLTVNNRFGTFMNMPDLRKVSRNSGEHLRLGLPNNAIGGLYKALGEYYDDNALSCFFAPLFPDLSRNNLWVIEKQEVM